MVLFRHGSRLLFLMIIGTTIGCIAKRETSELFLRGSIAESSEVVQLDPVFLSRQRQVESRFFGFDDQASAEHPNGQNPSDAAVESGADELDVAIEVPSEGFPPSASVKNMFPVDLSWPLDGHITSPFGMRRGRLHAGVDIKGLKGDPIIAAADGQILLAKRKRAYGIVAILGHEHDTQTLYAHMLRLAVREGQFVRAGEVLGYVGRSGRATGYHLHFETRVSGGIPQDPMRFLPTSRPAKVGFVGTGDGLQL
jgi:murein DD-endopeptidase MepM/ murein hydrolase activator NlpD